MSVNKVILLGNVGREPDVRYIDDQTVVAKFSLATSERRGRDADNTPIERTEWHELVGWNNMARRIEKAVHKGSKLYIEGHLRTRSYEDKSGVLRHKTEIMIDKMDILSFPQGTPNAVVSAAMTEPDEFDDLADLQDNE